MENINKDILKYVNRYAESHYFTRIGNGNVQWTGNFEHHRVSYPNDYSKAWHQYLKDDSGEPLSLSEFEKEMHISIYDENGMWVKNSDICEKYSKLVEVKTDIISMVDPSGGPYLEIGSKIFGKEIKNFIPNEYGYEIVINDELKNK